jgi:Na+/melibiose symporter-like transporter
MIMADVIAVFGTLLALGIALPGLLLTCRMLLPNFTDRAQSRLSQTPWRCLFAGGFLVLIASIPIIILFNLPWGGFQAMGAAALIGLMAIASLGAAGLAGLIGRQLRELGLKSSEVGATLWGGVAMGLAAVFPLVGWFVFLPLAFVVTLGAAAFALLGWMPRNRPQSPLTTSIEEAPATA